MNDLFNAGKELLKGKLKRRIILTVVFTVLPYIIIPVIVVVLAISPILEGMNLIENIGNSVSGFFDKAGNFLSGRGFQEITMAQVEAKETEFNEELKNYYSKYALKGVIIDAPLILSTVYYPMNLTYDEKTAECMNGDNDEATIAKCKEANMMTETDQYDVWKSKIKKLPILIRHSVSMVTTEYSCDAVSVVTEDGPKTVYVEGAPIGDPVIDEYPPSNEPPDDEKCTSTSSIKKYTYKENKEGYDKYHRDEYILNSPEYDFPKDLLEPEKTSKLNQLIISIHELSELYNTLFKPPVIAQQIYGAIPYNIVTQLRLPINGDIGTDGKANYKINSCFQPYRELSNGQKQPHNGIDLGTRSTDKNIKAVADGTVIEAVGTNNYNCFWPDACTGPGQDPKGNHVVIVHNIGGITFTTYYLHLSSVSVALGTVKAGDTIGVMGDTGNSNGAHLHFEYRDSDNNPINPGNLFDNPFLIAEDSGCTELSVDCASRNSAVAISPLYGKWGNKSYPINVRVNGLGPIPLEQYILGVSLNEMPASYNTEAIKAQLVAARTYTFGSNRYLQFELEEAQNQIVIDMGVASQATQTFNLNGLCGLKLEYQTNVIQSLQATRGQVLISDRSGQMFSSEYSSCAANDGTRTLGDGYVCKLPECVENVEAYCTEVQCKNSNGDNACGHGRGMSQRGAQVLATKYGNTYNNILTHYYNAQITDLSNIDLSRYNKPYNH